MEPAVEDVETIAVEEPTPAPGFLMNRFIYIIYNSFSSSPHSPLITSCCHHQSLSDHKDSKPSGFQLETCWLLQPWMELWLEMLALILPVLPRIKILYCG